MQGDELTDAEKDRILRVGVFYDDVMERKRAIYEEFWCEMPESETIWYQHSDPPAHDPVRNRIATIRQPGAGPTSSSSSSRRPRRAIPPTGGTTYGRCPAAGGSPRP